MSHHWVRFFFCSLLALSSVAASTQQRPIIAIAAVDSGAEEKLALVPQVSAYLTPINTTRPYVNADFQASMYLLRSEIMASAVRHNIAALSGLSDYEFALVLTALLYFENNGVLQQRTGVEHHATYCYQHAQTLMNYTGLTDFSVWPANLRPSVGLSLLRGEMPYIDHTYQAAVVQRPITIYGSHLQVAMHKHPGWEPSLSAVAAEITDPVLAVEYLAANFEMALYRADYDWVPHSWMTLVAWHNQGLVDPQAMLRHHQLQTVLPQVAMYLPVAHELFADWSVLARVESKLPIAR